MSRQFPLQLLDLIGLRLDLCRHQLTDCAQLSRVFGQGFEGLAHGSFISVHSLKRNGKRAKHYVLLGYPACVGRHVRCGVRQSMPSNSIDSCAAVRCTFPSLAAGQTNRPFSRRFMKRHAPCVSHQMIFNKSPRRPRKTNRCPEYGSSASSFFVCAASVLNPRRISVTPAASQTRVLLGTGIMLSAHGSGQPPMTTPSDLPPEYGVHPTA